MTPKLLQSLHVFLSSPRCHPRRDSLHRRSPAVPLGARMFVAERKADVLVSVIEPKSHLLLRKAATPSTSGVCGTSRRREHDLERETPTSQSGGTDHGSVADDTRGGRAGSAGRSHDRVRVDKGRPTATRAHRSQLSAACRRVGALRQRSTNSSTRATAPSWPGRRCARYHRAGRGRIYLTLIRSSLHYLWIRRNSRSHRSETLGTEERADTRKGAARWLNEHPPANLPMAAETERATP